MKRIAATAVAGLGLLLAPVAQAQSDSASKPLSVTRILSSIPEGQPWGNLSSGLVCLREITHLIWGSKKAGSLNPKGFELPAREELKREGYTVAEDPSDPFGQKVTANTTIGATITGIHGEFCVGGSILSRTAVKGTASIDMDCEVYSNLERRVVAKVHTRGDASSDISKEGGYQTLLIAVLDDSLRGFTASDSFKKLMAAGPPDAKPSYRPTKVPWL
jgi:hypothetical protein